MLIVHNLSLQMCFVLLDINVSTVFCLRDEAHLRHSRPRRQRIVWAVVIDDKLQLPFLIGEGKHNDIFVVISLGNHCKNRKTDQKKTCRKLFMPC